MNSADRIKYMRTFRKMTQRELAKLSGVSIDAIKKYEANRSNPRSEQLEKLAFALDISPYALNSDNKPIFEVKTIGDMMGLLIYLIDIKFLYIDGVRKEDGHISKDTFRFKFSDNIAYLLSVDQNNEISPLTKVTLILKDHFGILDKLIKWEKITNEHKKATKKYEDSTNPNIIKYFEEMNRDISLIEMHLMSSSIVLTTDDSISVLMPADRK